MAKISKWTSLDKKIPNPLWAGEYFFYYDMKKVALKIEFLRNVTIFGAQT